MINEKLKCKNSGALERGKRTACGSEPQVADARFRSVFFYLCSAERRAGRGKRRDGSDPPEFPFLSRLQHSDVGQTGQVQLRVNTTGKHML